MPLPISNSLTFASCRHPFWGGSLRTTGLISTITIIILLPFGCIVGIGGRDGWGRGVQNRWWSSFGVNGVLLMHLLLFIRVAKNDDVAIAGQSKKPTVEVIKESLSELLIP
jgi:hypothetical protein